MESYYPELASRDFREKLMGLEEFKELKMPALNAINTIAAFENQVNQVCTGYEKFLYQQFLAQYLSNRSPYRSILLFHGLGVGKTCSAITLAESLMDSYSMREKEPRIWVVSKDSLRGSFQEQVFDIMKMVMPDDVYNQCTGDKYSSLLHTTLVTIANRAEPFDINKFREDAAYRSNKENINTSLFNYINQRYKFVSYGKFSSIIQEHIKNNTLKEFARDKTIIIDEAHNLINTDDTTRIDESGDVTNYMSEVHDVMTEEETKAVAEEPTAGASGSEISEDLDKELDELKNEVEVAINLKTKTAMADTLGKFLRAGTNIRLVLMSATPMYDKPFEIFWLLSLLLINDKREGEISKFARQEFPNLRFNTITQTNIDRTLEILKPLASQYISYIRGRNPFAFATRISMKNKEVKPRKIPIEMITSPEFNSIEDGLVTSKMSDYQRQIMARIDEMHEANRPVAMAQRRIANHVVFTNGATDDSGPFIGENGFRRILQKTESGQYKYNPGFEKYLSPAGSLAQASPKIKKICDLIANSEGVIVVYSEFIWGGLVPTAIALEHMGLRRFIPAGTTDAAPPSLLAKPGSKDNGKKYVILTTGELEKGAGGTNNILKALKGPENIDGKQIKVVLISQVAGEGITIPYVREIHVLTPWYHMNLIDQVIGRGIRTCSHIKLPIQKRNVTIYLHTLFDKDILTEDLKTYLIAANKKAISERMIGCIRDNALDCFLMQNVNYFPKSLFKFGEVKMETSQRREYKHIFGDNEAFAPKCGVPATRMDSSMNMRYEVFAPLVELAIQRMRKYISSRSPAIFFYTDDLITAMGQKLGDNVRSMALKKAMQDNVLFKNMRLSAYDTGFILERPQEQLDNKYLRISIAPKEKKEDNLPIEKRDKFLDLYFGNSQDDSLFTNKLYIYETLIGLDSKNREIEFKELMKMPIFYPDHISPRLKLVFDVLDKEGVFIHQKEYELNNHKDRSDKIIGYFNILNTKYGVPQIVIFNPDNTEIVQNIDMDSKGNVSGNLPIIKNRDHFNIMKVLREHDLCFIYNNFNTGKKKYDNLRIMRKFKEKLTGACKSIDINSKIRDTGTVLTTAKPVDLIESLTEPELYNKNKAIVDKYKQLANQHGSKRELVCALLINYLLENAPGQICFAPFFKPKK